MEKVRITERDVALMDLYIGDGPNGIEIGLKAQEDNGQLAIVVLTSVPQFLDAAADDSTLLGDDIFRRFLTQADASQRDSTSGLTAKERQVLACIANADSNSKIAEKLNLRARTLENYVANIFSKLGARRRSGRDPRVQAALYFLSSTGRLESDSGSARRGSHSVDFFAGSKARQETPLGVA